MEEFLEEIEVKSDNEEPLSFKNRKVLFQSARKIVKNARKYSIKQKPRIIPKTLTTSDQSDPLEKHDKVDDPVNEEATPLLQVPTVKKIILAPRDSSNTIKIISLPQKLPPRATVLSNQKVSFSVPTELMVPSTSKATHVKDKLQTLMANRVHKPFVAPTISSSFYADLRLKWMSTVASREQKKLLKRLKTRPLIKNQRKVRRSIDEIDEIDEIVDVDEEDEISKNLEPESFPKAIVYPDAKTDEKKLSSKKPLTYSKVFEEAAKLQNLIKKPMYRDYRMKSTNFITLDNKSEGDPTVNNVVTTEIIPLPFSPKEYKAYSQEGSDDDLFEVVLEDPAPPEKKKEIPTNIKYLIAQNLLASNTDKAVPVVHVNQDEKEEDKASFDEDEHQFEAVSDDSQSIEQTPTGGFSTFPLRPEINCMLMENIAYYRVIAQYLLKKKNIPTFDFENTDNNELINVYRSFKR